MMNNKIKILSVYWWLIDFGPFKQINYLIDLRESISRSFNTVTFSSDPDKLLVFKNPDFVKKGLEIFLDSDKELNNVFYTEEKKEEFNFINFYSASNDTKDVIKLLGHAEIKLSLMIKTRLMDKLEEYMINRDVKPEVAAEFVRKMFIIP